MIPISLLAAYIYCPRKIYLQKVLKLYEPTRESNLNGAIKHSALEKFSMREREIVSSISPEHSFQDIEKAFEKILSSEIKNSIIEKKNSINRLGLEPSEIYKNVWNQLRPHSKTRTKVVWNFIRRSGIYGIELWECLTPKIKSEYSLQSEIYKLTGVVDQIFVYPNKLFPVELKSGKPPSEGVWPGDKTQLAAYILALEDNFDIKVQQSFIYYMKEEEYRIVKMNPFLKQDVIKTRELVENLILSNSIPPISKKENKCNNCSLKKKCYDGSFIKEQMTKKANQQKTLNST